MKNKNKNHIDSITKASSEVIVMCESIKDIKPYMKPVNIQNGDIVLEYDKLEKNSSMFNIVVIATDFLTYHIQGLFIHLTECINLIGTLENAEIKILYFCNIAKKLAIINIIYYISSKLNNYFKIIYSNLMRYKNERRNFHSAIW